LSLAKEFKSSRIANALKEMPPVQMVSAKKKIREHRPITPLIEDVISNSEGWYGANSRLESHPSLEMISPQQQIDMGKLS
jgi:hypothetical protein